MSGNRKILLDQLIQVTGLETTNEAGTNSQVNSTSLPTKGVIIPFIRGECGCNVSTANSSGVSTGVVLCTFGMSNYSTITLTNPTSSTPSFTQSTSGDTHAFTFVMPYDGILRSIYMTSCNYPSIGSSSSTITPYVALFTADPGSRTFTLLSGTKTPAAIPWTGTTVPNCVTTGYQSGLDITIAAGTRIAIVGGCDTNGFSSFSEYIEYAGSLYFSHND